MRISSRIIRVSDFSRCYVATNIKFNKTCEVLITISYRKHYSKINNYTRWKGLTIKDGSISY